MQRLKDQRMSERKWRPESEERIKRSKRKMNWMMKRSWPKNEKEETENWANKKKRRREREKDGKDEECLLDNYALFRLLLKELLVNSPSQSIHERSKFWQRVKEV